MRNGKRWFFTIIGVVLVIAGSAWAYTLVIQKRVTTVEVRMNCVEVDIKEVKWEQRALRDRVDDGFADVLKAIKEDRRSP